MKRRSFLGISGLFLHCTDECYYQICCIIKRIHYFLNRGHLSLAVFLLDIGLVRNYKTDQNQSVVEGDTIEKGFSKCKKLLAILAANLDNLRVYLYLPLLLEKESAEDPFHAAR